MATTAAGEKLTEQHRLAQLRLRARFIREFVTLWGLLDIDRLDETTVGWLDVTVDAIIRWREQSAARAQAYYNTFRAVETGQEPFVPPPETGAALTPNLPQIRTSLLVTGPIGYKSRIAKGFTPMRARAVSFTAVAGAASRHVMDAGRRQLIANATADEMAVGFSRVTDGDPCAFCAMLASRGPTYITRATAFRTTERSDRGAGQKYHDHCGCSVEPSFDRNANWPQQNREFSQLWAESTKGYSGKDALNAFRRALNARKLGA